MNNNDRYRKFASSPDDEISGETSTTRLYAYDLVEVKALCVDGKTKSDVIRELVRRALYQRRYRQASTDPAFREILKTFDDMLGVRLHHMEKRLAERMEADHLMVQAVIGYLYLAAYFGMEEMKQIRLRVTPDEVSDEEFLAAWKKRFESVKEEAGRSMQAQADKRRRRIEAIAEDDGDDR